MLMLHKVKLETIPESGRVGLAAVEKGRMWGAGLVWIKPLPPHPSHPPSHHLPERHALPEGWPAAHNTLLLSHWSTLRGYGC